MVRELTEKSGQYFSYVFHNGFRFDMTFLTKALWLSLWQTQDVSFLRSKLTTLKLYTLGCHVKFADSVKYYQQPFSKLACSIDKNERKNSNPVYWLPCDSKSIIQQFFLEELTDEERDFALWCLSFGKGFFLYETVTGFRLVICNSWQQKFLG